MQNSRTKGYPSSWAAGLEMDDRDWIWRWGGGNVAGIGPAARLTVAVPWPAHWSFGFLSTMLGSMKEMHREREEGMENSPDPKAKSGRQ